MQVVLNVTKIGQLLMEIEQQGYTNSDGQLLTNDASWHRVRQAVSEAEKSPKFFISDESMRLIETIMAGDQAGGYSMSAVVAGEEG